MSYFEDLNNINVNDKVEKKNGLTYLSWAWAWGEVKKKFPKSFYTIYENDEGWCYHTDGRTGWVKTGVTIIYNEQDPNTNIECEYECEHIEYLPIMDFKNKSIPLESITSFDVNKAIQRSLTKAVARHGLGLYIYAGEDLPEEESKKLDETITEKEATALLGALEAANVNIDKLCEKYKVKTLNGLSARQYADILRMMNDRNNTR